MVGRVSRRYSRSKRVRSRGSRSLRKRVRSRSLRSRRNSRRSRRMRGGAVRFFIISGVKYKVSYTDNPTSKISMYLKILERGYTLSALQGTESDNDRASLIQLKVGDDGNFVHGSDITTIINQQNLKANGTEFFKLTNKEVIKQLLY
jgi:hypothetical protein